MLLHCNLRRLTHPFCFFSNVGHPHSILVHSKTAPVVQTPRHSVTFRASGYERSPQISGSDSFLSSRMTIIHYSLNNVISLSRIKKTNHLIKTKSGRLLRAASLLRNTVGLYRPGAHSGWNDKVQSHQTRAAFSQKWTARHLLSMLTSDSD